MGIKHRESMICSQKSSLSFVSLYPGPPSWIFNEQCGVHILYQLSLMRLRLAWNLNISLCIWFGGVRLNLAESLKPDRNSLSNFLEWLLHHQEICHQISLTGIINLVLVYLCGGWELRSLQKQKKFVYNFEIFYLALSVYKSYLKLGIISLSFLTVYLKRIECKNTI